MEESNIDGMFDLMLVEQQKKEVQRVISCNEKTEQYGLSLTVEDAQELMVYRSDALQEARRIEFGEGILPELIFAFCDSDFINQDNYTETLGQLQELFYMYKNESQDGLTDTELIKFMRIQFDEVCFGDIDYLRETCLERFARAVRAGHQNQMQSRLRDEYVLRETENEYEGLDEETRWEREVYFQKLEDLFG
ncbi:MAG: DUF6323 family protein [Lachnospiraceae bacterium]